MKTKTLHDNHEGCGLSWLVLMPPCDVFHNACLWHDRMYEKHAKGQLEGWTRKMVDRRFLEMCLILAGKNKVLRAKACCYYRFARIFGGLVW